MSEERTYPELVLFEDDPAARMVFVPIPPGEFWMGSRGCGPTEEPRHLVRIPAPPVRDEQDLATIPAFWMARTPVTQAQFRRWTSTDAYRAWFERHGAEYELNGPHANTFGPGDDLPAETMSWYEAHAYCEWLAEPGAKLLEGLGSKLREVPRFELPPEAHWEYACRGRRDWGGDMEYGNGDGEAVLDAMGWFNGNNDRQTHAVGFKDPNGFGLYDMHGNVWEWCRDVVSDVYRWLVDGEDACEIVGDGSEWRVLRGGPWDSTAGWCRSAVRFGWLPGDSSGRQGFRPCLLPGPVPRQGERGALQQAGAEAKEGAGEGGGTPTGRAPTAAGARGAKNPLDDLILPQRPSDDPSEGR